MTTDSIVLSVIEKFSSRSKVGIDKYGTTLNDNNNDDYLKHLQEELMDAVNYIEKLIQMRDQAKMLEEHKSDTYVPVYKVTHI